MMQDPTHIDKAFHSKNRFIMNNFRYHIDYTVKQTKDLNGKFISFRCHCQADRKVRLRSLSTQQ